MKSGGSGIAGEVDWPFERLVRRGHVEQPSDSVRGLAMLAHKSACRIADRSPHDNEVTFLGPAERTRHWGLGRERASSLAPSELELRLRASDWVQRPCLPSREFRWKTTRLLHSQVRRRRKHLDHNRSSCLRNRTRIRKASHLNSRHSTNRSSTRRRNSRPNNRIHIRTKPRSHRIRKTALKRNLAYCTAWQREVPGNMLPRPSHILP
jgi:hypothetical protein